MDLGVEGRKVIARSAGSRKSKLKANRCYISYWTRFDVRPIREVRLEKEPSQKINKERVDCIEWCHVPRTDDHLVDTRDVK